MANLSELIQGKGKGKGKGKGREAQPAHEKPPKFPGITDWVIYFWGDPTQRGPAIPMQMKVTSGIPDTGQVSGIAFFDPGTPLVDTKGKPLQVPPLLPAAMVPYSSQGHKLSWMSISEFRALVKREVAQAKREVSSEATAEIVDSIPREAKHTHAKQSITLGMESTDSDSTFSVPPIQSS